jgi:threonine dehydrogenase-like Zn-dependent dehydrogenase
MSPSEFEPMIKLVASKRIDVKPLITHEFPIEKIKDGLELVDKRPGEVLRAIITY